MGGPYRPWLLFQTNHNKGITPTPTPNVTLDCDWSQSKRASRSKVRHRCLVMFSVTGKGMLCYRRLVEHYVFARSSNHATTVKISLHDAAHNTGKINTQKQIKPSF